MIGFGSTALLTWCAWNVKGVFKELGDIKRDFFEYKKEVEHKFDKVDTKIEKGIGELSVKFDKMSDKMDRILELVYDNRKKN